MAKSMSKERVWREAIADYQGSGVSVRAFCRGRQLNESSFYYWRKEIRDREAECKSGVPPVLAPVVLVDDPPGEAASQLSTPQSSATQPSAVIEIVLDDGTTVRVPPGSTRTQLAVVFAVLEPTRC
jgi:transposase-like protein